MQDVGLPADDATFATWLEVDLAREHRLLAVDRLMLASAEDEPLVDGALSWLLLVYEGDQPVGEWSYRARISASGKVLELRRREPPRDVARALGGEIFPVEVLLETRQFLYEQGVAVDDYGEPQLLRSQSGERVDRVVSYRRLGDPSGPLVRGIDVYWAGSELLGFRTWVGDPDGDLQVRRLEPLLPLLRQLWVVFVLAPVLAWRTSQQRERGLRRRAGSWRVLVSTAVLGGLAVLLSVHPPHGGWLILDATWDVIAWLRTVLALGWVLVLAWLAEMSWSLAVRAAVDPWASGLVSFRALAQLRWRQAAVGDSCLRGMASGLLVSGSMLAVTPFLPAGATLGAVLDRWWLQSAFPGVTMAAFHIAGASGIALFHLAFLLPLAVRRWGAWPGATLVAVLLGLAAGSPIDVTPLSIGFGFWVTTGALGVILTLRYDLLTALSAMVASMVAVSALPFLRATDAALQLQGWIAVAAVSLPLMLSLREVGRRHREGPSRLTGQGAGEVL